MIGTVARAVFFVLLPAIGVGGALGAPVLLFLAGAFSFRPSQVRQAFETGSPTVKLLMASAILAIGSTAWSEYDAATQATKVGVLGLFGLLFTGAAAGDRRLTRAGAVAAFAVLAALLAIEAVGRLPLNQAAQPGGDFDELTRNVSRGASLLLVMTFGAAGALLARPGPVWKAATVGALIAGGFISLQFGQFANAVGFAVGLGLFVAGYAWPRLTLIAVAAGLLLWLVAAPFATPLIASAVSAEALPFSWNARVEIWTYVSERIWERPWIGHGLDAGRAHLPEIPVHPHSASLQIWFELGVAGVLLAAAVLISGTRDLVRSFADNRPAAAAAAGTLGAFGVVANLSFNLWAEWWLAAMFLAAGIVGALGRASR